MSCNVHHDHSFNAIHFLKNPEYFRTGDKELFCDTKFPSKHKLLYQSTRKIALRFGITLCLATNQSRWTALLKMCLILEIINFPSFDGVNNYLRLKCENVIFDLCSKCKQIVEKQFTTQKIVVSVKRHALTSELSLANDIIYN